MIEFATLRPKTYSYLRDNDETKKAKSTETCVIKQKHKFEDYKNFLEANQLEKEIKHLAKINLIQIINNL